MCTDLGEGAQGLTRARSLACGVLPSSSWGRWGACARLAVAQERPKGGPVWPRVASKGVLGLLRPWLSSLVLESNLHQVLAAFLVLVCVPVRSAVWLQLLATVAPGHLLTVAWRVVGHLAELVCVQASGGRRCAW